MAEREYKWATQVEMEIPTKLMYPTVVVENFDDARTLVEILNRAGVAVNLRSVRI